MSIQMSCLLAAVASCLPISAFAQTNFPESEPNSQKLEADPVIGIVNGDTITGVSSGSTTTLGLTTDATVDVFRVRTAALPLGIYAHRLTLTTATTTGHTGTIRGLNQTGAAGTASTGGTPGTVDSTVQSTSTATSPARSNLWYGFGKQEEIYYRVAGTTTTTAAYTATMSTSTVPFTTVGVSFESASPITFSTIGQTTINTMIHLFDGNLNAIPGASNNDEGPVGPTTQSRLTRTLAGGVYYLSVSTSNTAWNLPAPPDDDLITGLLMDFPGSLVRSSTSTVVQDFDFTILAANGQHFQTAQLPAGAPYEVLWFQIFVQAGAPPIPPVNDACAAAFDVGTGGTISATSANNTNGGTSTCDPFGNDVWFTYTNNASSLRLFSADTCGSSYDTVLTVYSACGGTELACNDDCGGAPCGATASCINGLPVNSGQTVLIRLSDKGLGGGAYTFNSSEAAIPPSNDDCSAPIVLPGPGIYPFDTTGATTGTQGQGTTVACQTTTSVKKDLWYTYTANVTGTVTFSTCGLTTSTLTDTKISYYAGAGCPSSASPLGCDDDGCASPGLNTILTFPVSCGQVFTIQLGNYSSTATVFIFGNFSVTETGTNCSTPSTPFCLGDGTGAACPCSNTGAAGHGCASSSAPTGAILSASGTAGASPGTDTLILTATNVPGPGLFFQSDGVLGSPLNFGDGHLCAAIGLIRLGIVFSSGGVASFPGGLTPNPIHFQGNVMNGDTKHYQCWYRSIPNLCNNPTSPNSNLTQGLSILWGP